MALRLYFIDLFTAQTGWPEYFDHLEETVPWDEPIDLEAATFYMDDDHNLWTDGDEEGIPDIFVRLWPIEPYQETTRDQVDFG